MFCSFVCAYIANESHALSCRYNIPGVGGVHFT